MRYIKRSGLISFALFLFSSGLVITADAQNARFFRRPVIVRYYSYDPFWQSPYWGWNDPYFYDPYLRERREKYDLERNVSEERKDLKQDQEKYARDGVITAREQEKLDKQARKLDKAEARLDRYNDDD